MNETIHSNCPIHSEQKEIELVEKIQGSESTMFIPIKKDILWLRESDSEVKLFYNNKHVMDIAGMSDFYGYLTSIENAISEAKKYVKHYGVDSESLLELRVFVTITDTPVLHSKDKSSFRPAYKPVGDNLFVNNQKIIKKYLNEIKKAKNSEDYYNLNSMINELKLKSKKVISEQIVWTSKSPETFEKIKSQILAKI